MKQKWPVVMVFLLIFGIIAGVTAVRFWFESDGIRILGNDLHAEVSGKCYIISPETEEILDETSVYISGSSSYADSSIFEGNLSIVGYQNVVKGTISSTMAIEKGKNGYWLIHHLETCTHQETVDGITKPKEHFCDYQYIYYLNPDLGDQVIIRIEPSGEDAMYAVCADTQEQALERYRNFVSTYRKV